MRIDSLLSPGLLAKGHDLRTAAMKCISAVELAAARAAGGKTSQAAVLAAFFTDCASKLSTLYAVVVPTVLTRVSDTVNTAVVTLSAPVEAGSLALTSIVFTPARVVTAIEVSGSTVTITATGAIATDSIAYTKPTTGFVLKDGSGNEVANFSGVLAGTQA